MKTRTQAEAARRNDVARALLALGDDAGLDVLEVLRRQPLAAADVATQIGEDLGETEQLLCAMDRVGLIQRWTKGAWQVAPLGGELWEALAPVLRAR